MLGLILSVCLASGAQPRPALIEGTVETEHFRIEHTARSAGTAKALAPELEAIHARFESVLGLDWQGKTEVRLGMGRGEMEALAIPGNGPPSWASALAYPDLNIILVNAYTVAEGNHSAVLQHELIHVALGQFGGPWPHWFHEGLALFLSGESTALAHYTAMVRAVTQDRVFEFEDLSQGWPERASDVEIAYAQSASFVSRLSERHSADEFRQLFQAVRGGDPFETAFAKAFKISVWLEEQQWRETLASRYSWWPLLTGGSAVWFFTVLLFGVAYWRRRVKRARRLAEMAEEDEKEQLEPPLPDEPPTVIH